MISHNGIIIAINLCREQGDYFILQTKESRFLAQSTLGFADEAGVEFDLLVTHTCKVCYTRHPQPQAAAHCRAVACSELSHMSSGPAHAGAPSRRLYGPVPFPPPRAAKPQSLGTALLYHSGVVVPLMCQCERMIMLTCSYPAKDFLCAGYSSWLLKISSPPPYPLLS